MTQNVHHAPVPSPEMQVFLARRYRLLLALRPPETHPTSSQIFCKSLIINKLPKHTLRLGTSESTQRQSHFCNLLIIKRSKIERWLWGGKFVGKLLFRSRRLECGEKSAGKIKFSFLCYLAHQSFVWTLLEHCFSGRQKTKVRSELNFAKSLKISILLKINSLLRDVLTWPKASCIFLSD